MRIEEIAENIPDSPDVFETLVDEPLLFVGMLQSAPASSKYLLTLAASTLKRSFYESSRGDAFSYALKKTNETLRTESLQGQDHWLGNLAAAACEIAGGRVRISIAGNAKAILMREGTAHEIAANEGETQLFSAIAEGKMQANDILLLGPNVTLGRTDVSLLEDPQEISRMRANMRKDGGALLALYAQSQAIEQPVPLRLPLHMITPVLSRIPLHLLASTFSRLPRPDLSSYVTRITNASVRTKRLAAIFSGIAILVLAVLLIVSQKQNGASQSEDTHARAQDLLSQAEAALILNDGTKTLALVGEALGLLEPQDPLRTDLTDVANKAELTQNVTEKHIASLPAFAVTFIPQRFVALKNSEGNFIFILSDPSYAGFWQLKENTREGGKFLFFPEPVRSGADAFTLLPNGKLVAATNEALVEADPIFGHILNTLVLPENVKISALAVAGNDVFVADTTAQQILRSKLPLGGFSAFKDVLRTKEEVLAHTKDIIVIESTVYALTQEGRIDRIKGGRMLSPLTIATPSGIPASISRLSSNGTYFFGLDVLRGRIVKIALNGMIEKQFENEKLLGARDFALMDSGTEAIVLGEKAIFKIPLQ